MVIIWGKRTYGAVHKVDNMAVKTVFGHLWYLPLFPMSSYYVEAKTDRAFQLTKINWRSVACGYIRVWTPIIAFIAFAYFQHNQDLSRYLALFIGVAAVASLIGSYVLDKKYADRDSAEVRRLMNSHFGVALDPYHCSDSFQDPIDGKMQSMLPDGLDYGWHKRFLNDGFASRANKELALLRARCDQHDAPLQQSALQVLATPAGSRAGA